MSKPDKTPAAPTAADFDFLDEDAVSATECTGMIPANPESREALGFYNEVLSYLPPDPPAPDKKRKRD